MDDDPALETNPGALVETQVPREPERPGFQTILDGLMKLQECDRAIELRKAKIEEIGDSITRARADIERDDREAAEVKQRARALLVEQKSIEGDLAKIDEEIKKHGGELLQVKTNDAYKALMTQIESLKVKKNAKETLLLELLDRVDEALRTEKELSRTAVVKRKGREDTIKSLEAERDGAQRGIDADQAARREAAAASDPEALALYERIQRRRGSMVLVPLGGGASCGGCHNNATAQMINDLKKNKDFVICERCQRILYLPLS